MVLFLGAAAGYFVGLRNGKDAAYKQTVDDALAGSMGSSMSAARAYLHSLEAMDSGSSEALATLRQRDSTRLRLFISDVEEMRDRDPYWRSDSTLELYTNATTYLAKQPGKK
jgi:hypothetical protein